ncbi:MOSC domain-containing protein [Amaricoccus macauensis]|uniref:MOSC domain-containing protein n=1 Tax=Amaricoccus macauensis TaxID=57001 RepID=UPI003C7C50D0
MNEAAAVIRAHVASLWRHPIKAHGVEAVQSSRFEAGQTMPWDRIWAIAHEASKVATDEAVGWVNCNNFSRGAKSPGLMAIRAETDESERRIRLTHPDAEPIEICPDNAEDAARLIAWVTPLSNPGRALPRAVVRTRDAGMTDSSFPSVAILNQASLRALEAKAGRRLSEERFRGNIWLDGLETWAEFDLVGKEIRIGSATFLVREPITRCMATAANPDTGKIDVDTLGLLDQDFGHSEFGVYAQVTESGEVAVHDTAVLA